MLTPGWRSPSRLLGGTRTQGGVGGAVTSVCKVVGDGLLNGLCESPFEFPSGVDVEWGEGECASASASASALCNAAEHGLTTPPRMFITSLPPAGVRLLEELHDRGLRAVVQLLPLQEVGRALPLQVWIQAGVC